MLYAVIAGVVVGILFVITWGLGAIKKASPPERKNTYKL